MTSHYMYALDKQQAYLRYRNQLRLQIRRRDYGQLYLNKSTILANKISETLENDMIEKMKMNDKDLRNDIKTNLRKLIYNSIIEVSPLTADVKVVTLAQDINTKKYEEQLKNIKKELEDTRDELAAREMEIGELQEQLNQKIQ